MTLNEFIEKLKKLQKEGKGDYQVAVQYGEDEFDYEVNVYDDSRLYIEEEDKQIIL